MDKGDYLYYRLASRLKLDLSCQPVDVDLYIISYSPWKWRKLGSTILFIHLRNISTFYVGTIRMYVSVSKFNISRSQIFFLISRNPLYLSVVLLSYWYCFVIFRDDEITISIGLDLVSALFFCLVMNFCKSHLGFMKDLLPLHFNFFPSSSSSF